MSNSYSATSSTSSSMATPQTQPSPPHGSRSEIIGIILGIIGLLCVAGVIYATLRTKRMKKRASDNSERPTLTFQKRSDRHHPAAQITSTTFGSEVPQIEHIPGSNMRIATRRPDGVWQFSDPQDSLTPAGVSEFDFDVMPPPSSAKGRFPPRVYTIKTDTLHSRYFWNLRSDDDRHYQYNIDSPPPTYGSHYNNDPISPHEERMP